MVDTSTEAVTKLLDGVTPGPWITVKSDVYPEGECDSWVTIGKQDFDAVALIVNEHIKDDPELKANARFIAAARDLVPALLAERDALKKERDEAIEGWHVIHPNITVQDAKTDAERFDRADWFWRVMDPDDSADTPAEAIHRGMIGDYCVCEIASSYTGPVRFGFTAPVLDPDSDDTEFLHFETQQEAIDAAKARAAALRAIADSD